MAVVAAAHLHAGLPIDVLAPGGGIRRAREPDANDEARQRRVHEDQDDPRCQHYSGSTPLVPNPTHVLASTMAKARQRHVHADSHGGRSAWAPAPPVYLPACSLACVCMRAPGCAEFEKFLGELSSDFKTLTASSNTYYEETTSLLLIDKLRRFTQAEPYGAIAHGPTSLRPTLSRSTLPRPQPYKVIDDGPTLLSPTLLRPQPHGTIDHGA